MFSIITQASDALRKTEAISRKVSQRGPHCMSIMDSPYDFSGSLKQQCLDGAGLYEWVRKTFKLHVEEGLLDIYLCTSDREPQSQLSLLGARHAKEWSISSAIAGYGFDIVLTSGKMWSFLADNEGACRNWY